MGSLRRNSFSIASPTWGGFFLAMPIIELQTRIKAPIERVFDLSRSIDLHLVSAGDSDEKVVAGKKEGLFELGDEVTWEGSHYKFRQRLGVKLTEMDRPNRFADEAISGAFKRMKHTHLFDEKEGVTTMNDEFDYKSRGGPLGWFIENSFLTALLRRFLADRNRVIKKVAESDEWQKYLPEKS